MSKRTIEIFKAYNAGELVNALENVTTALKCLEVPKGHYRPNLAMVDVEAVDGRTLSRVALQEETLSDGSKVYNVILGFE